MKPFRERNPVPIGAISLLATVALVFAAFHAQDLPLIGGGDTYSADFVESGDIQPMNEVRVAGVKVGQVTGVQLEGDHVKVKFRIKNGPGMGTATRAAIKLKTVVGARYLELDPAGPGDLSPAATIPVSRTTSPFTIDKAFSGLSQRIDAIDTTQLAQSFDTISNTFKDTPGLNHQALVGLSRLSKTIAGQDGNLKSLLGHTQDVVKTLNARDAELTKLITDADVLLRAVQARRDVIDKLLLNTAALANQLKGLAQDNQTVLNSALGHLNQVLGVLQNDRDQLQRSIQLLAPYSRLFTNTLGNGRWFDTLVYNLLPNVDPTAIAKALSCAEVNGSTNPLCSLAGALPSGSPLSGLTGGTK